MAAKRDQLSDYRAKRDFDRTSEPADEQPTTGNEGGAAARFVIQEHHARRLHWDLRLERDGVLVSWALPRGVPRDPDRNRLAVHTEDHPLDYIDFAGDIPKGEYGGGTLAIWDRGTYEAEKWEPGKVIVRFDGERVSGRYALFRTRGKDWMIHRMDPPELGAPLPELIAPMLATAGRMPSDQDRWAFEIHWDGERAIALCDTGHLELLDAGGAICARAFRSCSRSRSSSRASRSRSTACSRSSATTARHRPRRSSVAWGRARTPRSGAGGVIRP